MKNAVKITLIIMAVIMLLSACANETPTFVSEEAANTNAPVLAKAEPTPEQTPEPTPEPMPETPAEIAAWVAKTYQYIEPMKASYYAMCSMPLVSDYAYIAEDFPKILYMFPFNTRTSSHGMFVAPKDITADVAAAATEAVKIDAQYNSHDYRDLTAWRQAADFLLPDTKEWRENRAEVEAVVLDNHIIDIAHVATDPSLVYIDNSGDLRVRAVLFQKTVQHDEVTGVSDRIIGIWSRQLVEYLLTKNENGDYIIWDLIYIEDGPWQLDEQDSLLFERKGFGDYNA